MPEWLNKIGPIRARLVTNIVVRGRPHYSDHVWPGSENGIEIDAANEVLVQAKRYFKGKTVSWPQPGVVKARVTRRIGQGCGSVAGQVLTSDPDATYREWRRADKKASEKPQTSATDGMGTGLHQDGHSAASES